MIPVLLAGSKPPLPEYDADILILSHHRLAETIAAVQSARGQTGGRFHVIVLDQASPAPIRAALAAAIGNADDTALYCIDDNLGVGGGRNLATSLGHGRVLITLDNDAVFESPTITANACERFAADLALGVIAFRILASDGSSLDETSWGYPPALMPHAAEHFPVTTFVGCGHAIARACWDELGGYDASLFFTWEEYEFSLRALAAGWRIEHHGDLAVIHGVAPEARVHWGETRWRRFVANRLLIAHDWHGLPGMAPRALFYLAHGLRAGLFRQTLGGLGDAWSAAKNRPRRNMTPLMRTYIQMHETRHRARRRSN